MPAGYSIALSVAVFSIPIAAEHCIDPLGQWFWKRMLNGVIWAERGNSPVVHTGRGRRRQQRRTKFHSGGRVMSRLTGIGSSFWGAIAHAAVAGSIMVLLAAGSGVWAGTRKSMRPCIDCCSAAACLAAHPSGSFSGPTLPCFLRPWLCLCAIVTVPSGGSSG